MALRLALAIAIAAGCGGPSIEDGAIRCAADNKCPEGFACAVDSRCYRNIGVCGDGELGPGEVCDPPGLCPQSCGDGSACTTDSAVGAAASCNIACLHEVIEGCNREVRDSCCPAGCEPTGSGSENEDADCSDSCGNEIVEAEKAETCDPPSSCPTTCDDGDGCTVDELVGDAANCSAECIVTSTNTSTCAHDDGCCPPACGNFVDNDCSRLCEESEDKFCCGNGERDPGEHCDGDCPGPGCCPENLADCGPAANCEKWSISGSKPNCTAECKRTTINACGPADGCCPPDCNIISDSDPDCVSTVPCDGGSCGCDGGVCPQ